MWNKNRTFKLLPYRKSKMNSIQNFKDYLFFPHIYWNHNWERQHEIIFRFSEVIDSKIKIMQPFGLIRHNLLGLLIKAYEKSIERSAQKNSIDNPVNDNMEFIYLNYVPILYNKIADHFNYSLLKAKLRIGKGSQYFLWTTYLNSFTYMFFEKASFKILDLPGRRSVSTSLSTYALDLEKRAVQSADIVFVDNQAILDDYKHLNENIYYMPQGVSLDRFNTDLVADELLQLKGEGKKILGYCGSLHPYVDYGLLESVIPHLWDWVFIFVGNIEDKRANDLHKFSNVKFMGRKKKDELVYYYNGFDIGLIPYTIEPHTTGIFPTKLFEYAACGLPIVSSALPELTTYENEFLKIYRSKEQFLSFVKELYTRKSYLKAEIVQFSKENTWKDRLDFMLEKIDQSLSSDK